MLSHVLNNSLNLGLLLGLSVASILICIGQIIYRRKGNFLLICKGTILLPLLVALISGFSNLSHGYWTQANLNEIHSHLWLMGLCRLYASISTALYLTIILAIVYAITATIVKNRKLT